MKGLAASGRHSRKVGGFRWIVVIAMFALAIMPIVNGASNKASAQDQIIVGLITKTESNPFFVKMREGAQAAADAAGVKLMTASGQFDTDNASQVTALENMTTAGAKGILIVPADSKAIVPSIQKARDAGVLVIALDTPTQPQDATDALFATDNFKAGLLIGQYARPSLGDAAASAIIATLDTGPGISVGVLRHNGFLTGLSAEPGATPAANTDGYLELHRGFPGGLQPGFRWRPGQGPDRDGELSAEEPRHHPGLCDQ